MKKIFVTIAVFLILLNLTFAQIRDANVTISTSIPHPGLITPEMYGAFIEFCMDKINSKTGMYAQELEDRGFDINSCNNESGVSCKWSAWTTSTGNGYWQVINGGFNPNGASFQRIIKSKPEGWIGIYQNVYVSGDASDSGFFYFKGDKSCGDIEFSLIDTLTKQVYFDTTFGNTGSDWKRAEFVTPPVQGYHQCMFLVKFQGVGSLDLDEASFMPLNNVFGVRKEYFDLYNAWKPGLLRYPGGWIADADICHWKFGMGPLEKRNAPLIETFPNSQRMDFGTNEYYQFCHKAGVGFQITVNFGTGTPEEAAQWVEYCNGDTNTTYGKLRASYGFPEPFNVKYWEIGNEQYGEWAIGKLTPPEMARKFLLFYKAMKDVDSTIQIIIDGSLWGGQGYYKTVMDIAGDSCDVYGWHLDQFYDPAVVKNDTASFLSMMGNSKNAENWLLNFEQWLKEDNYYPKTHQGITEWYTAFGNYNWWSHERTFSMETALWTALHLNMFMRHANSFTFSERSCLGAIFVRGFDSKSGKRIIAPSPTYHVMNLMRNHSGSTYLDTYVDCDTYNTPDIEGIWAAREVKWIDATSTRTNDSLFISLVNRNPVESINSHLTFDSEEIGDSVNIYQLAGVNMLDSNYADNPEAVKPVYFHNARTESYLLPPHSLTILALSIKKEAGVDTSLHNFKFYPNPALNNLFIDIPDSLSGNVDVSIYDIIGNKVYSASLQCPIDNFCVDISNLEPGTYLLKYVNNNSIRFYKFVKLKES